MAHSPSTPGHSGGAAHPPAPPVPALLDEEALPPAPLEAVDDAPPALLEDVDEAPPALLEDVDEAPPALVLDEAPPAPDEPPLPTATEEPHAGSPPSAATTIKPIDLRIGPRMRGKAPAFRRTGFTARSRARKRRAFIAPGFIVESKRSPRAPWCSRTGRRSVRGGHCRRTRAGAPRPKARAAAPTPPADPAPRAPRPRRA
jgi:hypothetical protein